MQQVYLTQLMMENGHENDSAHEKHCFMQSNSKNMQSQSLSNLLAFLELLQAGLVLKENAWR